MAYGGFGGGNMQQLLKQAQKMQEDLQKKRTELDEKIFTGSAAGNMVTITMLGNKTVSKVEINPDVLDDAEMLEDLVLTAINDVVGQIVAAEKDSFPQLPAGM